MITFVVRFNGRFDNLGDQVIFINLVRLLRTRGVVATEGPIPLLSNNADFESVRPYVDGVCDGSRPVYVEPPGAFISNSVRLNIPVDGIGIGLGNSVMEDLDNNWAHRLKVLGLRDAGSIASFGGAHQGVSYFPDLAFVEGVQMQDNEGQLTALSFRRQVPELRNDRGSAVEDALRMADIAADLVEKAQAFYHQVGEDRVFNEMIAGAANAKFHDGAVDLHTYRAFYRSCKYVISNRLHCLLLGAVHGAIPIAVTHSAHRKVVSLFETVGWNRLVVRTDQGDTAARINELMENSDDLRDLVRSTVEKEARSAQMALDTIMKNL